MLGSYVVCPPRHPSLFGAGLPAFLSTPTQRGVVMHWPAVDTPRWQPGWFQSRGLAGPPGTPRWYSALGRSPSSHHSSAAVTVMLKCEPPMSSFSSQSRPRREERRRRRERGFFFSFFDCHGAAFLPHYSLPRLALLPHVNCCPRGHFFPKRTELNFCCYPVV